MDPIHLVPFLICQFIEISRYQVAGIAEQPVEPAIFLYHKVTKSSNIRFIFHICAHEDSVSSLRTDLLFLLFPAVLRAPNQDYTRAFASE